MKKIINEKTILGLLIILNVFVISDSLIDYKMDKLIDVNNSINEVYIYKK